MAELKEYQVGDYTFRLSAADVDRLKKSGSTVTPVERKAAQSPTNKGRQPANKAKGDGDDGSGLV